MDRCARPFTGQLRGLARAALDQQGIAVKRLRWMGQHTNHLFRCDTAGGERLVVRVCPPGGRSDAELNAELAWLAADLGRVIATLHQHAQGFRPPPGFTRPVLDIGYLTWAGTWHADQLARRPVDPATRRLLAETAGRTEAVLALLGQDPAAYGLVHADLCLDNVLDHHGQARPIDFDDASWGHYALDLAIAADDIPEDLHQVLLDGYQTVRPLPPSYEEHQAALLAARRLYLAIWHLANGLPDEGHLGQLAAFAGS